MKYQITSTGNIILADQEFMDIHYPGDYTLLPDDATAVSHDPITKREFLKKFTPSEYAAIKTAAAANATLDYYWQQFLLADFIELHDADTIGGINLLESVGLIAAGRAAEILA